MFKRILLLLIIFASLAGCKQNYTPKPSAYCRINYPERQYKSYTGSCGFSFDIPVYSEMQPDSDRNAEPYWYNLYYIPFKAKLHLSYKPVNKTNDLMTLKEDSRELVYKHTVKADEITESFFSNQYGNTGILYELEGNTATAVSFYITDSTANFMRGSLYFSTRINRDSLDPVIDFLEEDIKHMISTFRWQPR